MTAKEKTKRALILMGVTGSVVVGLVVLGLGLRTYAYAYDGGESGSSVSPDSDASGVTTIYNIYIDASAKAGGDGLTPETAKRTIQEAWNVALTLPGPYRFHLAPGTYYGCLIPTSEWIGSGPDVTVITPEGDNAYPVTNGSPPLGTCGVDSESDSPLPVFHVRWRNLTLKNLQIKGYSDATNDPYAALIMAEYSAQVRLQNVWLQGDKSYYGIYESCVDYDCDGSLIWVENSIIDGFKTGIYTEKYMNPFPPHTHITATNSIFVNNEIAIDDLNYWNSVIRNNIFIGNDIALYWMKWQFDHNISWNNRIDTLAWQEPYYTDTWIRVDPLLGDDYLPLPTSPVIDAGNPDPRYNDPDGTRNDIGLFGGANAYYLTSKVVMFPVVSQDEKLVLAAKNFGQTARQVAITVTIPPSVTLTSISV
ncbi:MAG: hypothetical protein D6706_06690, partial [Chloroflexi bacterium]